MARSVIFFCDISNNYVRNTFLVKKIQIPRSNCNRYIVAQNYGSCNNPEFPILYLHTIKLIFVTIISQVASVTRRYWIIPNISFPSTCTLPLYLCRVYGDRDEPFRTPRPAVNLDHYSTLMLYFFNTTPTHNCRSFQYLFYCHYYITANLLFDAVVNKTMME